MSQKNQTDPIDFMAQCPKGKLKDYPVQNTLTTGRFRKVQPKAEIKPGDLWAAVCGHLVSHVFCVSII